MIHFPATRVLALAILIGGATALRADVKLPAIFGDHMVLQQDSRLPVWGTAEAGEKVSVSIAGKTAETTAGSDGKWRVELPALPVGSEPATLIVTGKNSLTFNDVLVGDVWICSGQSNMEFSLGSNEKVETDPQLRFFHIPHTAKIAPQTDVAGKWEVCDAKTAASFSAVGYYFGHELRSVLKRPIGLIESSWGGTPAQAWTPIEGLKKDAELKEYADSYDASVANFAKAEAAYPAALAKYQEEDATWQKEVGATYLPQLDAWKKGAAEAKAAGKEAPPQPKPAQPRPVAPRDPNGGGGSPAALYNGMIAPLIPYAIKGVIWYQGESNAGKAVQYKTLFGRMISQWRENWGQGDFPFLFVQLAAFGKNGDADTWPFLRESQLKTLALPKTGMASAVDVGDPGNIHPKDKKDVGLRLALAARHIAYGEDVVFTGPIYESMKVDGNTVRVKFTEMGGGLVIGTAPWHAASVMPLPADKLVGFAVAGEDKKWSEADAKIDGDIVAVSSAEVTKPVAVRYAWHNSPEGNLYNKEGLPASPFRSDDWPQPPAVNAMPASQTSPKAAGQ